MSTAKSSAPLSTISKYVFNPAARKVDVSGNWDPATMTLTPFNYLSDDSQCVNVEVWTVLDALTLATEAGIMRGFDWPQQLFANLESFELFLGELAVSDESYRIKDQWWQALASLVGMQDVEEAFSRADDIAQMLMAEARQFGRLSNFGKSPDEYFYQYTLEQCHTAELEYVKNRMSEDTYLKPKASVALLPLKEFSEFYSAKATQKQYDAACAEGLAILAAAKSLAKPAKAVKKAPARTTKV